jgi:hypothetical protein
MAARDDVVLATVRDFVERSGALGVAVLLDRGEGHGAPLVECRAGEPLTVTQGTQSVLIPDQALEGVAPLPLSPRRPVPPTALEFDSVLGEVSGPIGVVAMLAEGVRELARVLGGRTVAVADFATRSGAELSISAREGDPVVLTVGDEQFELPA